MTPRRLLRRADPRVSPYFWERWDVAITRPERRETHPLAVALGRRTLPWLP